MSILNQLHRGPTPDGMGNRNLTRLSTNFGTVSTATREVQNSISSSIVTPAKAGVHYGDRG